MARLLGHPTAYSHSSSSFSFLFPLVCSITFAPTFVNDLHILYEMPMVEAKICQRRSKTWSGLFCGNSRHSDNQCKKWESAEHGTYHAQFPGVASFCYFKCQVSSTGFRQQPENHHACVLSESD